MERPFYAALRYAMHYVELVQWWKRPFRAARHLRLLERDPVIPVPILVNGRFL